MLQSDFDQGFTKLVREHFARAVRYCSRMLGDIGEGEEVAQQAFVKLLEKRKNLEQTRESLPYLYRVLRNACVDHIRARKHESAAEVEEHAAWLGRDLANAERAEISQVCSRPWARWMKPSAKSFCCASLKGWSCRKWRKQQAKAWGPWP